jgi:hypothetical protein
MTRHHSGNVSREEIERQEDQMPVIRSLVKSAVVLKLLDVARREAAKPENQAKARELAMRLAREFDRRRAARTGRRG